MNTLNKKNNYIQNYMLMGAQDIYNMALFYMVMVVMMSDAR